MNQSENLSGIEIYNDKLIKILHELNFEIDEYSFIKSLDNKNPLLINRSHNLTNEDYKQINWYFRNSEFLLITK